MGISEWALLGAVLLMMLAPLGALTVVSLRLRRKGWWLGAPWVLLILGALAVLQAFQSMDLLNEQGDSVIGIMLAGLIVCWLGLTIWLIVLTAAGPKLPPPGIAARR